jgi:outer membrane protein OmpA-like peptidoglycan-associated protein
LFVLSVKKRFLNTFIFALLSLLALPALASDLRGYSPPPMFGTEDEPTQAPPVAPPPARIIPEKPSEIENQKVQFGRPVTVRLIQPSPQEKTETASLEKPQKINPEDILSFPATTEQKVPDPVLSNPPQITPNSTPPVASVAPAPSAPTPAPIPIFAPTPTPTPKPILAPAPVVAPKPAPIPEAAPKIAAIPVEPVRKETLERLPVPEKAETPKEAKPDLKTAPKNENIKSAKSPTAPDILNAPINPAAPIEKIKTDIEPIARNVVTPTPEIKIPETKISETKPEPKSESKVLKSSVASLGLEEPSLEDLKPTNVKPLSEGLKDLAKKEDKQDFVAKLDEIETINSAPAPKTENKVSEPKVQKLDFKPKITELDQAQKSQLEADVLSLLKSNPKQKIQIKAFAAPENQNDKVSSRRLSLARALSIRSFLLEKGIEASRIDVRAMGDNTEKQPLDRVEILFSDLS